MNLPRSTFYYRAMPSETEPTDAEIIALVEDIQDEFPCYGYRRVTHELRRRGLIVNHKKVARIMRLAGLGVKPQRRYMRTTDSRHDQPIHPNLYRNRIPDRPDQVWVADFTYIRVAQGLCYLAVILDACSARSWLCAVTAPGHTARAGRPAISRHEQEAAAGMHSSHGQGLPIRIPALSRCPGCCRFARLDEQRRESLSQRPGRKLHEDPEGRGGLSRRLRNLRGCRRSIASLHRAGLQLPKTAFSPRLPSARGIRNANRPEGGLVLWNPVVQLVGFTPIGA